MIINDYCASVYCESTRETAKFLSDGVKKGIAEEANLWKANYSDFNFDQLCDLIIYCTKKNVRNSHWKEDDIDGIAYHTSIFTLVALTCNLADSYDKVFINSFKKYFDQFRPIKMLDKSNLNLFLENMDYKGSISRVKNNSCYSVENVLLNDFHMNMPCGACITTMSMTIDENENIKTIACKGIALQNLYDDVNLTNIFLGLRVRISGTMFDSYYQLITFSVL